MPAKKKPRARKKPPVWPIIEEQLTAHKTTRGSALERLIRDNQDFQMLRPEEAHDRVGLPPWLRVYWRKHHPEAPYSARDPAGGYPRALRRLLHWMTQHQDFAAVRPAAKPATRPSPTAGGRHGQ
jgi:hypothetical protein